MTVYYNLVMHDWDAVARSARARERKERWFWGAASLLVMSPLLLLTNGGWDVAAYVLHRLF